MDNSNCTNCRYGVFEPDGQPFRKPNNPNKLWLYIQCAKCKQKVLDPIEYNPITITMPVKPKKVKLYEMFLESKLEQFLQSIGTSIAKCPVVEIKDTEADLYGDFICVQDYKFKSTYGQWQCLQTPTEKHVKQTVGAKKAPNDHYNK